jgi:hypothetical protein
MTDYPRFAVSPRNRSVPLALIALGAGSAICGIYSAPDRTWPNLLLNGFYFTSLSLSALFFLATQWLTGARWSASLRRIPEAFMMALPVAALLMLVVFFGRETLYPWARPGGFANVPAIAGKARYLQTPWVFARVAVALLAWIGFAWLLRKTSLEQDRNPGLGLVLHHRLTRYAAVFVLVFAVTFTAGAFDWLISLDPEWFSTMFGFYAFIGTFVQGIAAITLATVLLKTRRVLADVVTDDQLHDLGKMLFAFSTFWAYIWTCQYLLIWYGNIPDEVTHYVKRTNGPWLFFFALNFLVNWVAPFTLLMSARAKRNPRSLIAVSVLLLFGHWLDLYMIIMPSLWSAPKIGVPEISIAAGYTALLYFLFLRNLARAPLVPVNDPILMADAAGSQAFGNSMRSLVAGVKQ